MFILSIFQTICFIIGVFILMWLRYKRKEKVELFYLKMSDKCCAYYNKNRTAIEAGTMPNPIKEVLPYLPTRKYLFWNPLEMELYIDQQTMRRFGWLEDVTHSTTAVLDFEA